MTPAVGSIASLAVGGVIALMAIMGGVSAVSPGANPASASEQIVRYDVR